MEMDTDGNGHIDDKEVHAFLTKQKSQSFDARDVRAMLDGARSGGNSGEINFFDFAKAVHQNVRCVFFPMPVQRGVCGGVGHSSA